jgi:hypothetical protein
MGDSDTLKVPGAPETSTTGEAVTGQVEGEDLSQAGAVIEETISQDRAALQEAVREYPTFVKEVASFSPESAKILKQELGMGDKDLIVGLPEDVARQFELKHGESVTLSVDGKAVLLEERNNRLVTSTPKGPLTKCALSKGIRKETGLKDHRETGTGKAEMIPFTMVVIGGRKVLWLKVDQKTVQE